MDEASTFKTPEESRIDTESTTIVDKNQMQLTKIPKVSSSGGMSESGEAWL